LAETTCINAFTNWPDQVVMHISMLVFCLMKPCGLVDNQRFREEYCLSLQGWRSIFLRNVCIYPQVLFALPSRRPTSGSAPS
jgi:hypothetical protein